MDSECRLDGPSLDSGHAAMRRNGFPDAQNHCAGKRRRHMDCGGGSYDDLKKISKIWDYDACRFGGRLVGGQRLPEALGCPFPPLMAGERIAAHPKSGRLFLSLRTYPLLRHRSLCADGGKPEIRPSGHLPGSPHRLFPALSLRTFPVGRAGIGSDRNAHRQCSHPSSPQDEAAPQGGAGAVSPA